MSDLAVLNGEHPDESSTDNNLLSAEETGVLAGEIETDDDDDDVYTVNVKMNKMTWGDQMIHARFQLLIETIGDVDDENTNKTQRVAALQELIAGFDELTAFLDRVSRVTCNGERVAIRDVPMNFIDEVMAAISKARQRKTSAKN